MKKRALIGVEFKVTGEVLDKVSDLFPATSIYNNASSSNIIIDLNEMNCLITEGDVTEDEKQELNSFVLSVTNELDLDGMILDGLDQLELYL